MSETFSKIILTKSDVASAEPAPADLDYGELAINYKDGKIFFKNDNNAITTIASSQFISDLNAHKNNTSNPHNVTKGDIGLGNVQNTSDAEKVISEPTRVALSEKADKSDTYTKSEVDQEILNSSGISLDDLSVAAVEGTPSGNGALTYNNQTGEFTYTPPALSEQGGITLSSLSVGTEGTASGNGAISYDNNSGEFTYTPPILNDLTIDGDTDFGSNKILYSNVYNNIGDLPPASTYHGMFAHVHATGAAYFAHEGNWIELANLSDTIITLSSDSPLAGDGSLTYDPNTREFIYDQPTPAGIGAQTQGDILDDFNTLGAVTGEDQFIVSTGDGIFVYQSGSTVRDSLGLGTEDTPEFNGVDLDGGELILNSTGEVKIKPVIDQNQQETPNTIDFILGANQTTESKLQISYAMVDNDGGAILPTATNDIDLGSATNKFKDLHISGTAYIDSIESDSVVSAGQFGFKGTPVKTVTQQTSITTGVTINSPAGTIECVNHTFSSGTAYEFTVINSYVSPEDVIILSFQDGDAYVFANVTDVNNGTFNISLIDIHNQGVNATLKINFAVIEHDQT